MVPKTEPTIRFWRKVNKTTKDACWNWLGHLSQKGYGIFSPIPTRKRPRPAGHGEKLAHRMAWIYSGRVLPEGYEVCHHCDNPACCNPDHLFAGTHADNMRDCMRKGRLNTQRGEKAGPAKLKEVQVIQIRKMYSPGIVSMNQIARLFGVSKRAIQFIIHRRNWKHVN